MAFPARTQTQIHLLGEVTDMLITFKDSQRVITNLKERLKELEEQLQEREVSHPVILLILVWFGERPTFIILTVFSATNRPISIY